MTRKVKGRFDYLSGETETLEVEQGTRPGSDDTDTLQTVPKGQGRMEQDRSQLNIRVPTALKRQAVAKAVLEGRSIGEVVEDLLRAYITSNHS